MFNYSSVPSEGRREEDDDYGDEYTWWDEYEDALEDGRFCED